MLTPYARAHLRLIEIDRRWHSARKRLQTRANAILWHKAQITADIAETEVENDQVHFNKEVHSYGH